MYNAIISINNFLLFCHINYKKIGMKPKFPCYQSICIDFLWIVDTSKGNICAEAQFSPGPNRNQINKTKKQIKSPIIKHVNSNYKPELKKENQTNNLAKKLKTFQNTRNPRVSGVAPPSKEHHSRPPLSPKVWHPCLHCTKITRVRFPLPPLTPPPPAKKLNTKTKTGVEIGK